MIVYQYIGLEERSASILPLEKRRANIPKIIDEYFQMIQIMKILLIYLRQVWDLKTAFSKTLVSKWSRKRSAKEGAMACSVT